MTLQERLRSQLAERLVMTTEHEANLRDALNRIDVLEAALHKIQRWSQRQGYLDIRNDCRAALAQPAKEEPKE